MVNGDANRGRGRGTENDFRFLSDLILVCRKRYLKRWWLFQSYFAQTYAIASCDPSKIFGRKDLEHNDCVTASSSYSVFLAYQQECSRESVLVLYIISNPLFPKKYTRGEKAAYTWFEGSGVTHSWGRVHLYGGDDNSRNLFAVIEEGVDFFYLLNSVTLTGLFFQYEKFGASITIPFCWLNN